MKRQSEVSGKVGSGHWIKNKKSNNYPSPISVCKGKNNYQKVLGYQKNFLMRRMSDYEYTGGKEGKKSVSSPRNKMGTFQKGTYFRTDDKNQPQMRKKVVYPREVRSPTRVFVTGGFPGQERKEKAFTYRRKYRKNIVSESNQMGSVLVRNKERKN